MEKHKTLKKDEKQLQENLREYPTHESFGRKSKLLNVSTHKHTKNQSNNIEKLCEKKRKRAINTVVTVSASFQLSKHFIEHKHFTTCTNHQFQNH